MISWSLVHTGGLNIDLYLLCNDDMNSIDGRVDRVLICERNECYNDEQLMGSSSLGPVEIGVIYSCSITAVNSKGTDSRYLNNISSIQGTDEMIFKIELIHMKLFFLQDYL